MCADQTATIFVYLEVPASYAVRAELSLAEISLKTEHLTMGLEPRVRRLAAAELAGRQILLARAEVPAAYYDSLTIVLGGATVHSGAALLKPQVVPGGESLAINVDLRSESAAVLSLVWQPGPAPAAGRPYRAKLAVVSRAVSPFGSLSFVSEPQSDCVLVVDRQTGRVVGAVRMGGTPRGLAYSSQRQQLYVALSDGDGIGVMDALTLRLQRVVPLGFGDEPTRLALSPDESTLYALNPGSRSLTALSTSSMQANTRVTVGEGPRSLAVDPVTGEVYVACEYEGEIQVYGATGLGRQASLPLVASPVEVIFAPRTRELYGTSNAQNRLQGLDLASGRNLGGQSLCGPARHLVFSPRSGQLYVAVPDCQEVAVLRPADGFEFAPLDTPGAAGYLAFDPSYRQLLVLLPQSASLAIVETNRGTLTHLVELGGTPYAVLAP